MVILGRHHRHLPGTDGGPLGELAPPPATRRAPSPSRCRNRDRDGHCREWHDVAGAESPLDEPQVPALSREEDILTTHDWAGQCGHRTHPLSAKARASSAGSARGAAGIRAREERQDRTPAVTPRSAPTSLSDQRLLACVLGLACGRATTAWAQPRGPPFVPLPGKAATELI
jgi:hypothetical protein